VAVRLVGGLRPVRIAPVAQIPAKLNGEFDQRQLTLLACELMGECRVHRFGKVDFFSAATLRTSASVSGFLIWKAMRAPPVLIVYPPTDTLKEGPASPLAGLSGS
jgi:hypothetical protein